jgi:3-hydroxyacyl-[acyl-carrier-protein] dehydratase
VDRKISTAYVFHLPVINFSVLSFSERILRQFAFNSRGQESMITQLYHHKFDRIEDYLHHRSPYLLVEKIVSIEDSSICTERLVSGDEFFLAGHFPGAPIFPGAMMQELTTQSAGILIAARYNPMEHFVTEDPFHNEYALGVLVKVKRARYKGFARPGDRLVVDVKLESQVADLFDFSASININGKSIMQIAFQLMNVPSKALQGIE